MLAKIKRYLKNPLLVYPYITSKGLTGFVPDELHLKLMYYSLFKRKLNLDNPVTYNEKLQWLKLHDRNPFYVEIVDKIGVKDWARRQIGPEYVVRTLASWDTAEEIALDTLPSGFAIKTNHDSSGAIICKDKSHFDLAAAKKTLGKQLKYNHYYGGREWPYSQVRPVVFAEELLPCAPGETDVADYKVSCFAGVPRMIEVHRNRSTRHTCDYYDANWDRISIQWSDIPYGDDLERPERLTEMLELSGKLSAGLPHVRVDWYLVGSRLLLGEMTLYSDSGFGEIDEYHDRLMGDWIDLSLAYGPISQ